MSTFPLSQQASTVSCLVLARQELQALGAACRNTHAHLQSLSQEHNAKAAALMNLSRDCARYAAALKALRRQHDNARALQAHDLEKEQQIWLRCYEEQRSQCTSQLDGLRQSMEARNTAP